MCQRFDAPPLRVRRHLSVLDYGSRITSSPRGLVDTVAWFTLVIIWGAGACLAAFFDAPIPCSLIGLSFVFLVPGLAVVRFLRLIDPLLRLALAAATSLALDVIVSIAMVYAGTWSPRVVLTIVVGIALVAAAVELAVASVLRPVNMATRRPPGDGSDRKGVRPAS